MRPSRRQLLRHASALTLASALGCTRGDPSPQPAPADQARHVDTEISTRQQDDDRADTADLAAKGARLITGLDADRKQAGNERHD